MKVLCFAASTHSDSINEIFANTVGNALNMDHIHTLKLSNYPLPIYNQDLETFDGIPQVAHNLFNTIQRYDILIIGFSEHNGSYTAAYKNAFDWMSRIQSKVFEGKKIIALATSPGPGGASSVLKQTITSMPYFGAEVLHSFSLPSFHEHFDPKTKKIQSLEVDKLIKELKEKLSVLNF